MTELNKFCTYDIKPTYLPSCFQRAVGRGYVMRGGEPARPGCTASTPGRAATSDSELVQPLQLLDEVRVQLATPEGDPAHGTARRVRLELLLACGTQDVVETECRIAHGSTLRTLQGLSVTHRH